MIHYTVDELIAEGDRVVMLGSCGWKNRRTGIVVQTPKADFLRLEGGKVVEFFEFFDTAKAMAASVGPALPAAT
jgi:ketosteroid isomerase-like protein